MPVDEGQENVRVRVRDPGLFVEGSFRTITVSEDQGIKAVIGKLKSDPGGSTVIQTYIFDREKWAVSEAEQWVKDHKRSGRAAVERRCLDNQEVRFGLDDRRQPKISGYAAVFDQETPLYENFFEQVSRGAFARTIEEDDIRALWNHNVDYVLGRTKNGTLFLEEDDKGLRYEIVPPDTTWAKDLITSIKRGDVNQASFGFTITKQGHRNEGPEIHRTLKEVRLYDVSPVTFPAYKATSADVHVRMIKYESIEGYLLEDTEEVILPEIEKPAAMTSKELSMRIEELKKVLG